MQRSVEERRTSKRRRATAAKDEQGDRPSPAPKREPSAYIKLRGETQGAPGSQPGDDRGLSVECARFWKELSTEDKASCNDPVSPG